MVCDEKKFFLQATKERKTRSKTGDVPAIQPTSMKNSRTAINEESLPSEPDQHQSGVPQIENPTSSVTTAEDTFKGELDKNQPCAQSMEDPLSSKYDETLTSVVKGMKQQWKLKAMRHLQILPIGTIWLHPLRMANQFQQYNSCKIN